MDSSFLEAVKAIYEKGKEFASKQYRQRFFEVAETPSYMKELGLRGDKFTISYGTISKHIGKDKAHRLSEDVWLRLPEAIVNPFAISEYYGDNSGNLKGYRIYTVIEFENGFVVAGVDVKNMGKNLEVNSISTVFSKTGSITNKEKGIFRSKTINPQQASLLERPNFSPYPSVRESDGKNK